MKWENYTRDPGKSIYDTIYDRYKNTREFNYDDWHNFSKWYHTRKDRLEREINYLQEYLSEPWNHEPRWSYDNMSEGEKLMKKREFTRRLKILQLELYDHTN